MKSMFAPLFRKPSQPLAEVAQPPVEPEQELAPLPDSFGNAYFIVEPDYEDDRVVWWVFSIDRITRGEHHTAHWSAFSESDARLFVANATPHEIARITERSRILEKQHCMPPDTLALNPLTSEEIHEILTLSAAKDVHDAHHQK